MSFLVPAMMISQLTQLSFEKVNGLSLNHVLSPLLCFALHILTPSAYSNTDDDIRRKKVVCIQEE